MRAAVATGANLPLTLDDLDLPHPAAGEVLVKVTACGVCYSDLSLLRGHYPFARYPVVPGHEITGVVTAVGEGVTFPEVGTAVGGQFLYDSCGHCDYCVRGDQILCPRKRVTGVVADGGYAEYVLLKAGFVTPLPDGLDPVAAAPLMCAGLTAFNGLRQGGGGEGGHDLAVLRIVDAAGETWGKVGFEVVQAPVHHGFGGDSGGALGGGEPLERGEPVRGGRHDEAALRLVLDGRPELVRQLPPQARGEQREVELGSRFLVGDQDVALAGAGGAARDRAAVDEDHVEAGPGRVQGAGGARDTGSDYHDVAGQSLGHASTMSHTTVGRNSAEPG